MKLQTDTEHQQDDADLRELFGNAAIDGDAGSVRSDEHAGQQVADDGRQTKAVGDVPEEKGDPQPDGKRENQVISVHAALPVWPDLGASIH